MSREAGIIHPRWSLSRAVTYQTGQLWEGIFQVYHSHFALHLYHLWNFARSKAVGTFHIEMIAET